MFDLGKIDLPRITLAKVQIEIRILSAICSLIRDGCITPPPPSLPYVGIEDYSYKISDQNSNSKCHLIIDNEMVALNKKPSMKKVKFQNPKLNIKLVWKIIGIKWSTEILKLIKIYPMLK